MCAHAIKNEHNHYTHCTLHASGSVYTLWRSIKCKCDAPNLRWLQRLLSPRRIRDIGLPITLQLWLLMQLVSSVSRSLRFILCGGGNDFKLKYNLDYFIVNENNVFVLFEEISMRWQYQDSWKGITAKCWRIRGGIVIDYGWHYGTRSIPKGVITI